LSEERKHIVIRGCGAISPLGHDQTAISKAYLNGCPGFSVIDHAGQPTPVAQLSPESSGELEKLLQTNPHYRQLDRSVLMAIFAARQATEQAGWLSDEFTELAVNIGSSRGATAVFEQHFSTFQSGDHIAPHVSPTTTLGNVSSWVAHAVNACGPQISHSITCSTALMAVANGVAWLKAGMAKRFLAGGTEAPLTPFTIAQMKAIGIYSKLHESKYPCQPYSAQKQNTFVLGEGAAILALESIAGNHLKAGDILVEAVGFGFESIPSKTGISADGQNFQQAMRHALDQLSPEDKQVDLIFTHTPGTAAGDRAELAAIQAVFPISTPALATNKWLLGHTLGASGALSLDYALHIFREQTIPHPHYSVLPLPDQTTNHIKRIMINAAGFGGNATSVIMQRFQ